MITVIDSFTYEFPLSPALLGYCHLCGRKVSHHPGSPLSPMELETKKILSLLFVFLCEDILNEADNIFKLRD